MAVRLPCRAMSLGYVARENTSLEAVLCFETEDDIVGKGTMSWLIKAGTLDFNERKTIFCGKAKRRDKNEVQGFTLLTIEIGEDGLIVRDKDGQRTFLYPTTESKTTYTDFLRSVWHAPPQKQ